MADVSRRPLREADRAQLFLVGALALSVIFVVLAVLLNTAIYTGNIATRDPGPGTGEVVEYENEATSMAAESLTTVNVRNNSSYSDLRTAYSDTIDVWSQVANAHSSATLADTHVSVVTTNRGTKIAQENESTFTSNGSDGGDADWTVANNSSARAFRMNVSRDSLTGFTESLFGSNTFRIRFENDTTHWNVYLSEEGGSNVTVTVEDAAENQIGDACSAAGDHVVVKLSAAEVGGQPCPALETLHERLDSRYTIGYRHGGKANGTYSLVVDRPIDDLETGADDAAGEPYAAPALYSADLQLTYRSSVVYYRTDVRVAPEEADV